MNVYDQKTLSPKYDREIYSDSYMRRHETGGP